MGKSPHLQYRMSDAGDDGLARDAGAEGHRRHSENTPTLQHSDILDIPTFH